LSYRAYADSDEAKRGRVDGLRAADRVQPDRYDWGCAGSTAANVSAGAPSGLRFELTSDKACYSVGERVNLTFVVENVRLTRIMHELLLVDGKGVERPSGSL